MYIFDRIWCLVFICSELHCNFVHPNRGYLYSPGELSGWIIRTSERLPTWSCVNLCLISSCIETIVHSSIEAAGTSSCIVKMRTATGFLHSLGFARSAHVLPSARLINGISYNEARFTVVLAQVSARTAFTTAVT